MHGRPDDADKRRLIGRAGRHRVIEPRSRQRRLTQFDELRGSEIRIGDLQMAEPILLAEIKRKPLDSRLRACFEKSARQIRHALCHADDDTLRPTTSSG